MTERTNNKESVSGPEDAGRRKALKTIAGGVTTIAAYNLLPTSWDRPIVESIFLPAHAQTSNTEIDITGTWSFLDDDGCTGTMTFNANGTGSGSSSCYGDQSGTYSVSGSTVTLSVGGNQFQGTLSVDGTTITINDGGFTTVFTRL